MKNKLISDLLDMGADKEMFNILGYPKDFAYNLVEGRKGFDVFWQEKGLKTSLTSGVSFEEASAVLLKEIREDFL